MGSPADVRRSANVGMKDRKSTRLNSSHLVISYAVFCFSRPPPSSTLLPYTTLFRSLLVAVHPQVLDAQPPRLGMRRLHVRRREDGLHLLRSLLIFRQRQERDGEPG